MRQLSTVRRQIMVIKDSKQRTDWARVATTTAITTMLGFPIFAIEIVQSMRTPKACQSAGASIVRVDTAGQPQTAATISAYAERGDSGQRAYGISESQRAAPIGLLRKGGHRAIHETQGHSPISMYNACIKRTLSYFGNRLGVSISERVIEGMIDVESMRVRKENDAFYNDPLQVANRGDFALSVLANGGPHVRLIGNFSFLKNVRHVGFGQHGPIYRHSNITPQESIIAGIGWLYYKMAIFGYKNGKLAITGWRPLAEAVKDYNGNGNPNYVEEIASSMRRFDDR